MTLGLYAYGIIETAALDEPPAVAGLDPARPVSIFPVGELAALVSEVDVSEFEGEELRTNLARSEWLEEKVRAHERVLDDAMERTTVVPMRFGSIFSTPNSLVSLLTDHREELNSCLELARGKAEWGVKVHHEPDVVDVFAAKATQQETGRDYLQAKREQLHRVEKASEATGKVAEEVNARLERVADGAAMTQPVGPTSRNVILSAAYLVPDANRTSFMETVEHLQEEHAGRYTFEVTGPWPPYNFTSVDVGGPRS